MHYTYINIYIYIYIYILVNEDYKIITCMGVRVSARVCMCLRVFLIYYSHTHVGKWRERKREKQFLVSAYSHTLSNGYNSEEWFLFLENKFKKKQIQLWAITIRFDESSLCNILTSNPAVNQGTGASSRRYQGITLTVDGLNWVQMWHPQEADWCQTII